MKYLELEHAGHSLLPTLPRVASVQFYRQTSANFQEISLDLGNGAMFGKKDLAGKQSYTDSDEMQQSEAACLADPQVQAEVAALDLPEGAAICVEPWTYGTDGMNDVSDRIIMVSHFCYLDF